MQAEADDDLKAEDSLQTAHRKLEGRAQIHAGWLPVRDSANPDRARVHLRQHDEGYKIFDWLVFCQPHFQAEWCCDKFQRYESANPGMGFVPPECVCSHHIKGSQVFQR